MGQAKRRGTFEQRLELALANKPEKCPKCQSVEVIKRHAEATFALPECFFKECEDCQHQWNHL